MKKEMLNITDDEIKPYFNIDSVQVNGVFYAAHRVYGLNFKQRKDIPTYHPDMKVFEVSDKNGKPIALFYSDYFRRPTKRGGAWMSAFAKQSKQRGQLPIIYNVCNNAKAPEGQPSLITWDEVTTLFHEFGHALHGILSNCKYNTLSGTAVARDFVEMPSQFNESFASIPEIFDHYARHTETGAAMPADLKERMLKSIAQTAYSLGENLAATCLDLAWHKISEEEVPSPYMAGAFEKEEPPQHRFAQHPDSSSLQHIILQPRMGRRLCRRLLQLSLDRGAGCEHRRLLCKAWCLRSSRWSGIPR